MWDEIKNIKSDKKALRDFGLTIGAILVILGGVALWRGRGSAAYLLPAGILLIGLGIFAPRVLLGPQKAWMTLAVIIGFFMSRVILAVLFYAIITPMGLIMKLSGKDMLDERIDKTKASYWHARSEGARPKESYENQF